MLIFQGRVKTFGSSMVASYRSASGRNEELTGVKLSTTCSASLWKSPERENQVRSLKWLTSTTNVLPFEWPTECPIQVSAGGGSTGSRLKAGFAPANSDDISLLFAPFVLCNG